jgi:hypothetical protein
MAAHGVFMTLECHVIRFYPLQGVYDSNLCDTLRNE